MAPHVLGVLRGVLLAAINAALTVSATAAATTTAAAAAAAAGGEGDGAATATAGLDYDYGYDGPAGLGLGGGWAAGGGGNLSSSPQPADGGELRTGPPDWPTEREVGAPSPASDGGGGGGSGQWLGTAPPVWLPQPQPSASPPPPPLTSSPPPPPSPSSQGDWASLTQAELAGEVPWPLSTVTGVGVGSNSGGNSRSDTGGGDRQRDILIGVETHEGGLLLPDTTTSAATVWIKQGTASSATTSATTSETWPSGLLNHLDSTQRGSPPGGARPTLVGQAWPWPWSRQGSTPQSGDPADPSDRAGGTATSLDTIRVNKSGNETTGSAPDWPARRNDSLAVPERDVGGGNYVGWNGPLRPTESYASAPTPNPTSVVSRDSSSSSGNGSSVSDVMADWIAGIETGGGEDHTADPWYHQGGAGGNTTGPASNWTLSLSTLNQSSSLFNGSLSGPGEGGLLEEDPLNGYPFPSMYGWAHIVLSSIVVTFIMLVIVLGNALVIMAVARDRNLKGLQNWFITSLAVSDLFVGLFIMPLSLANELMGYWIFGNVLCELWLATDVLLCTASILNLCLISLDRYWSVTRAVSYVKQRTRKRAIIMIVLVWALAMIICFPPLVGWKRPQPYKFGYPLCVLSEEPGYVVYSNLGSFYIPLAVMVLVYFKIYLAARARARRNLKKPTPHAYVSGPNGKSTSTSTTTSFSNPCNKLGLGGERLSPTREFSSMDEDPSQSVSGMQEASSEAGGSGGTTAGAGGGGGGGGGGGDGAGDVRVAKSAVDDPGSPLGPTSDSCSDPILPGGIKMSVTNHNAHAYFSDERRKLLSETDSACDTPTLDHKAPGDKNPAKHIQFSEDTDSTSTDYAYAKVSPHDGHNHSENNHHHQTGLPTVGTGTGEDNLKPLLEGSPRESDSQRESDRNSNHTSNDKATGHSSEEVDLSRAQPDAMNNRTDRLGHSNNKDSLKPEDAKHDGKNHSHHHHQHRQLRHLSPNRIRGLRTSLVRKKKKEKPPKCTPQKEDPEKMKRKIARAKERRATVVLGIIMVTFIGCWLPFFFIYPVSSLAGIQIHPMVFAVIFWLGYCNSALNPIIYTIFNQDFRKAFHRIIFGRRTTF